MKTNLVLRQLILMTAVLLFAGTANVFAQIDLGKVKSKAKEKVAEQHDKKKSSTATSDVQDSGLSCDELVAKADGLYDAENYTEAMKYYTEAENKGCVAGMDGESRVKMNNCKKAATEDPNSEENKKAQSIMDKINTPGGLEELTGTGPKKMQPLAEADRGAIIFSSDEYTPGKSDLTAKINLPHPFKYYNEFWCSGTSCDYDHGDIVFYVELDGKMLTWWSIRLWDAKYVSQKDFSLTLCTKTDADFGNGDAGFNNGDLIKDQVNKIVYGIYDEVYGGWSAGAHELKIKVISNEAMYGPTFEATPAYFNQFFTIAEGTVKINLTDADRTAVETASSSKKLSHATGDWVAVDAHLKKSDTYGDAELLDVACQTEWKVTTNTFGVILYRTCKADVIYRNKAGKIRKIELAGVREDYNAGAGYSKPYFTEHMTMYYQAGSDGMDNMHFPLSPLKVK